MNLVFVFMIGEPSVAEQRGGELKVVGKNLCTYMCVFGDGYGYEKSGVGGQHISSIVYTSSNTYVNINQDA